MIVRKTATMAALLLLVLALMPTARAGEFANEANVLLQRIEANALDVRENAARLKTYTRFPNQSSWEVHADQLRRIRATVNDMSELLGEFQDQKDQAMLRQNKAMNFIIPEAVKLSKAVESAIEIVNNERQKLEVSHPGYEKQVEAVYDHADKIVASVGLAESPEEIEAAQKKLLSESR